MELVKKQSAVEIGINHVIDFIRGDSLEVGQKLPPENEMCSGLGLSRATLREIYRNLQALGYIELVNGKGAFIKCKEVDGIQQALCWFRDHKSKMKDYLDVRTVLDPFAAEKAAVCRTDSDIEILREIESRFEVSVKEKDFKKMADIDSEFHAEIARITGNDLLIALVNLVNIYCLELRTTSFKIEKNAHSAIDPHRNIIEAIIQKNVDVARDVSLKHVMCAMSHTGCNT